MLPVRQSPVLTPETAEPMPAKFNMEFQWDGETKVYSNDPGHVTKMAAMPIYDKFPLEIFFSETSRLTTFELGIQHQGLRSYKV